jgi:hypothetical protein
MELSENGRNITYSSLTPCNSISFRIKGISSYNTRFEQSMSPTTTPSAIESLSHQTRSVRKLFRNIELYDIISLYVAQSMLKY